MFARRSVLSASRSLASSSHCTATSGFRATAAVRAIQTSRIASSSTVSRTEQTEIVTPSYVPAPSTTSIPKPFESLFPENLSPPSPSMFALLESLRMQPPHYLTVHIQGQPFLVTVGDRITLPFLLKDVRVGDVLRLTHASVLGSREFTMKGNPWIDSEFFECRARVVEVTSEPMRIKEKKKQRNRRTKTVKSKHQYTVLTISELVVKEMKE